MTFHLYVGGRPAGGKDTLERWVECEGMERCGCAWGGGRGSGGVGMVKGRGDDGGEVGCGLVWCVVERVGVERVGVERIGRKRLGCIGEVRRGDGQGESEEGTDGQHF